MVREPSDIRQQFERGVVILSLDTEQMWGYSDLFSESQFRRRYPDALGAHTKLLACLERAGIGATWLLVGGMALSGTAGPQDYRMAGLPSDWTARVPAGDEGTAPLWYRPSFMHLLRKARSLQEIGLHGGLTHFIWTDPRASREVLKWELAAGAAALEQASIRPVSFSFGREAEAQLDLLPAHGIHCYRGRTVSHAFRLGPTLGGKLARFYDEVRRSAPAPVWPDEVLPGLWRIPSSTFLYPIKRSRTMLAGLRSRIERFSRGIESAARYRGIFHFCLHPENLTESPDGFSMFEEMLERLTVSRARGDIEVLTMAEVTRRMERRVERLERYWPAIGAGAIEKMTPAQPAE
jgi:peptidoglycan/xylan/chitin deacetylase (PgdA/CDA1 family)